MRQGFFILDINNKETCSILGNFISSTLYYFVATFFISIMIDLFPTCHIYHIIVFFETITKTDKIMNSCIFLIKLYFKSIIIMEEMDCIIDVY